MNLEDLNILKDKLLTAEDIEEPWHYFMNNFGEKQEFHAFGHPTDHSFLQDVLEKVAEKIFKQPVMVAQFLLTEIPEYQFYHGACMLDAGVMVVFYFKEADTGLFMLMTGGVGSQGLYGRFTCLGSDDGKPGTFPGPLSKRTH